MVLKHVRLVLPVAVALALGGCAGGDDAGQPGSTSAAGSPSASVGGDQTSAAAGETAADAADPAAAAVPAVDSHEWEDGLVVSVSGPEPMTPGESAVGADAPGEPTRIWVTIENGSKEDFSGQSTAFSLVKPDGQFVMERIVDLGDEHAMPAQVTVPAGESATYGVDYMLTSTDGLKMTVIVGDPLGGKGRQPAKVDLDIDAG